jgi:modulator of FtsH protease HflK
VRPNIKPHQHDPMTFHGGGAPPPPENDRKAADVLTSTRRFLGRWGWRRILAAAGFLYALSGCYFVYADQQAVVLVFESVWESRIPPGLHWTWPAPVARVEKLKVLETKRLTVGIAAPDQVLGRGAGELQAQFLTGDQNIVNIRLAVQYAIKDPVQYLFAAKDITAIVSKVAESSLSAIVVQRPIDDLLTTEKVVVQQYIQQTVQQRLDTYNCGVHISSISIETIAPPEEAQESFRDVASAREDRERIQREAESYANDLLPRARGEADQMRQEAAAYSARKTNEATGDAARFSRLAAEYAKARTVTNSRLLLETMEEVLPRMKKIVVDGSVDMILLQKK